MSEQDIEKAFSVLREEVGDVTFLQRAAMEARYPRPQDENQQKPGGEAGREGGGETAPERGETP